MVFVNLPGEPFALDLAQPFGFNLIRGGSTCFHDVRPDLKDYFIVGMYHTDKRGESSKGRRHEEKHQYHPPSCSDKERQ